jgi:hypothetical protein
MKLLKDLTHQITIAASLRYIALDTDTFTHEKCSLQGLPSDATDRAERVAWLGHRDFVAEDHRPHS